MHACVHRARVDVDVDVDLDVDVDVDVFECSLVSMWDVCGMRAVSVYFAAVSQVDYLASLGALLIGKRQILTSPKHDEANAQRISNLGSHQSERADSSCSVGQSRSPPEIESRGGRDEDSNRGSIRTRSVSLASDAGSAFGLETSDERRWPTSLILKLTEQPLLLLIHVSNELLELKTCALAHVSATPTVVTALSAFKTELRLDSFLYAPSLFLLELQWPLGR